MTYRQRNARKARDARQQQLQGHSHTGPPEAASGGSVEPSKARAAQALLAFGLRTSLKSFSRMHGVEFKWARRLLLVAGSVLLEEQREVF